MAKEKKGGLTNKHLHARIAFLHKAAGHLATQESTCYTRPQDSHTTSVLDKPHVLADDFKSHDTDIHGASSDKNMSEDPTSIRGLPLFLTYHFRQVAQKAQIRLEPNVKHSFCKSCNNVLVEGSTSKKYIENLSRRAAKPHADVMVLECCLCGTKKRFPIGARRQAKKSRRADLKTTGAGEAEVEVAGELG